MYVIPSLQELHRRLYIAILVITRTDQLDTDLYAEESPGGSGGHILLCTPTFGSSLHAVLKETSMCPNQGTTLELLGVLTSSCPATHPS